MANMTVNTLTPIDAKNAVTDISRTAKTNHDVSKWFETETLTLSFGEYVGRPSADYTLKAEVLPRFLESGWTIVGVASAGEDGNWVETGGTKTTSTSKTTTVPAATNSDGNTETGSGISTSKNESESTSQPLAESPAHWHAWQTVTFRRRRLVPEYVMQTMTDDFADAYNTGRKVEDTRYADIVSLYSLMLNRSENEGNAIVREATDLLPLANSLADAVLSSVKSSGSAAAEVAAQSSATRKADVNAQFDALVSQAKAKMIEDGTYNGTVWPSVLAGIEKKRSEALDKAEESAASVKMSAYQSAASSGGSAAGAILSAMQSVANAADQRKVTVVELRNNVLKWMLDYIASREETYPEVEDLATLTERLGFSYASAGSVL